MERHDCRMLMQRRTGGPSQGMTRRELLRGGGAALLLLAGGMPLLETPSAKAKAPSRLQYDPTTDPLQLNPQLRDLAERFRSGTANRKLILQRLFDAINVRGTERVKTVKSDGRPPRTAIETLGQGGDCTEFATLVVSLLREMRIPGGAMVVHFKKSPSTVDHMVPYAEIDGERLIVDLQTRRLGSTKEGEYSVLLTLDYDQAAAMYHREWGDYLRDKGRWKKAITAYKKALSVYEKDAYTHQNVAVLYGRTGNDSTARKHLKRAAELEPEKHSKMYYKRVFIQEKNKGVDALNADNAEEARRHLQAALDSGHDIEKGERRQIERIIASCDRRIEQERAEQAFNEGRFVDAIRHFQESLDAAERQAKLGGAKDRKWNKMIMDNIALCKENLKQQKK